MSKKLIIYILITFFCMLPISTYAWDNIGYYAQYNGSNGAYDSDNCQTSGRYSYTKWGEAASSITWYRGVSPTDYTGYAAGSLNFTFRRDLETNKFYDIRIRFNGKDVRPYVTADSIDIYTGTTQCRVQPGYQSDLSMISFINNATTDENSDYIQIRLYASIPVANWQINISQARQSTSTNWGVKDIIFREVDMSGNNAIIENNTINSNNIINNNKQNTQDIINNQNQNTQNVIDNQNQIAQQQEENQKVCNFIDKSNILIDNKYLSNTGVEISNDDLGITDYIKITGSTILTSKSYGVTTGTSLCFYNSNKTLISCLNNGYLVDNTNVDIPNNSEYVRFSISKVLNKPQFKVCTNGNQALTDSITSDAIPSGNDYFDDFNDMLPSNNTISSLITLPISLYTKVLNSINGTCSAITLGSLYNTNLVMPCINLETYLGSTLFGVIDLIMSGGFVLIISKKMVKAFHNFTSMKEGDVINND